MTEIECRIPYYGFINTEFIQWALTDGGHLHISTLQGHYVFIGREKWRHKRAFLGPGKIEFKLPYGGSVFVLAIQMNPIRERSANELLFRAGSNGVFNLASRPFSSIFKPKHEQIDPDRVWPFSLPENKTARGIAKAAICLADAARSRDNLRVIKSILHDKRFAWMEVFGAVNTYAIVTNGLTKTAKDDYMSINRALPHEFCALGFFTAYAVYWEFLHLLIEMKNRTGLIDVEALGRWALNKAGYDSSAYPREKGVESKLETIGEELQDYLMMTNTIIAQMEDRGEADWARE